MAPSVKTPLSILASFASATSSVEEWPGTATTAAARGDGGPVAPQRSSCLVIKYQIISISL